MSEVLSGTTRPQGPIVEGGTYEVPKYRMHTVLRIQCHHPYDAIRSRLRGQSILKEDFK